MAKFSFEAKIHLLLVVFKSEMDLSNRNRNKCKNNLLVKFMVEKNLASYYIISNYVIRINIKLHFKLYILPSNKITSSSTSKN